MRNDRAFWRLALVLLVGMALGATTAVTSAIAQTPLGSSFTYQGQLRQGGIPAEGSYDLHFELFDDPDSGVGTSLGAQEECGVAVINGRFTVTLDFGEIFTGDALWIDVGVAPGGPCDGSTIYTPLSPLQEIKAAPNALFSRDADLLDGIDSAAFLREGQPITGTLVLSGTLELGSGGLVFADGSVQTSAATGLGTHNATQNIAMNGFWLSGDGDDEGIQVPGDGSVNLGRQLFAKRAVGRAWELTSVDPAPALDTSASTFDGETIFVSYYGGAGDLMLAKSTDGGASWFRSAIDTQFVVGSHSSIFAVSNDVVFISYYDEQLEDLKFAKTSDGGNTWSVSRIDTVGDTGRFTSLYALDENTVYISYIGPGGLKLAVTGTAGTIWSISPVGVGASGPTSIIALDLTSILISYDGGGVKLARTDNGGVTWSITEVSSDSNVGTSMAMADANHFYISYFATSLQDLKVAKSSDGGVTWSSTIVDSAGQVGRDSSLVAFDADRLQVVYYDLTGRKLKSAYSSDGSATWSVETIDGLREAGLYIGLAASGPDSVFASYSVGENFLRVAKLTSSTPAVGIGTESPASDLQVKGYMQIGLTGGRPPVIHCNENREYGRMKLDPSDGMIYLCSQMGWIAK